MATADPLIHPVILLPTMSQSLNVQLVGAAGAGRG